MSTLPEPSPDRRPSELVASLNELAEISRDFRRAFPGMRTEGGYLAGRLESAMLRLGQAIDAYRPGPQS